MLISFSPVRAQRWQLKCIVAGLLLATLAAAATTPRNAADYEGIVTRNPFQLKPPAPPEPPPPPPVAPPSNIELTGLSTAFGERRVYMTLKDQKGQPVHKAMRVGDPADDGVEVLSLDISSGEVRVRNRGIESLLTMKSHGAKVPVGAAPAPLPVPTPFRPPGQATQPNAGGMPAGIGADGMPAGIGGAPASPAGTPAVIPTRSIRVPAAPQGQPTSQAAPQLSREVEEQIVNIELQRLLNQGGPPLPPTPLSTSQ